LFKGKIVSEKLVQNHVLFYRLKRTIHPLNLNAQIANEHLCGIANMKNVIYMSLTQYF